MKRTIILLVAIGLFLLGVACQTDELLPTLVPALSIEITAVPTALSAVTFEPTAPSPPQATVAPPATFTAEPTRIFMPTATITAVPTSPPLPTMTPSPVAITKPISQTIGYSSQNRPIVSYQFGSGQHPLVFIGGIHGGYEWNSILLAYEMIDYFTANPEQVPSSVTMYIIPTANPDGQFVVTGQSSRFTPNDVYSDTVPGRFNSNAVDLNRNWDCEWTATAVWRDTPVSGGNAPFSEPETAVLRDYFLSLPADFVLFWHSSGNGVFAAGCPELYQPSMDLGQIYGTASGYPVYERFDFYSITGDAGDWLSLHNIPSISIELKTHNGLDWQENLAGVLAILAHFGDGG